MREVLNWIDCHLYAAESQERLDSVKDFWIFPNNTAIFKRIQSQFFFHRKYVRINFADNNPLWAPHNSFIMLNNVQFNWKKRGNEKFFLSVKTGCMCSSPSEMLILRTSSFDRCFFYLKVWSCSLCYSILHLQCIQKWARDGAAYTQLTSDDTLNPADLPWYWYVQCICLPKWTSKSFGQGPIDKLAGSILLHLLFPSFFPLLFFYLIAGIFCFNNSAPNADVNSSSLPVLQNTTAFVKSRYGS